MIGKKSILNKNEIIFYLNNIYDKTFARYLNNSVLNYKCW